MTIYAKKITVDENSSKEEELEVEGYAITQLRLRFPPGPEWLLKVAVFYGTKQVFPWNEGEWFIGDDEIIEWEEFWELPESPCKLKIKAVNEDQVYEHSVFITINVKKRWQLLAEQIVKAFRTAISRMLGFLKV